MFSCIFCCQKKAFGIDSLKFKTIFWLPWSTLHIQICDINIFQGLDMCISPYIFLSYWILHACVTPDRMTSVMKPNTKPKVQHWMLRGIFNHIPAVYPKVACRGISHDTCQNKGSLNNFQPDKKSSTFSLEETQHTQILSTLLASKPKQASYDQPPCTKHLKHYHKYFCIHIYSGRSPEWCYSSHKQNRKCLHTQTLSQHQHSIVFFSLNTCVHM